MGGSVMPCDQIHCREMDRILILLRRWSTLFVCSEESLRNRRKLGGVITNGESQRRPKGVRAARGVKRSQVQEETEGSKRDSRGATVLSGGIRGESDESWEEWEESQEEMAFKREGHKRESNGITEELEGVRRKSFRVEEISERVMQVSCEESERNKHEW